MPIALGELDLDEVLRYMGTPPSQAGPELRALAHTTDEITDRLDPADFQANICLNYGGRDEILRAIRRFAAQCAAGEDAVNRIKKKK